MGPTQTKEKAKKTPPKIIESFNPATLEKLGEVEITPPEEVQNIVDRAREAQPGWAALGFKARAKYILAARDYLRDHIDDYAEMITLEMGKPRTESLNAEIVSMLELMSNFAHNAEKMLADEAIPSKMLALQGRRSYISYEPLGVIGIISPWNFPFVIPMSEIVMSLLLGNTAILKPAQLTCLIAEKIKELFVAANLPQDVFALIQGRGSGTGQALLDSNVDRLVFTGSVDIGKQVMRSASSRLTPVTLELGGKDPMIVLSDANLTRAANGAVWGAFVNAGQCCASVERVYVMEDVADKFIDMVVEKTKKLRLGNGMDWNVDVGPMINKEQLDIAEAHIKDAVAKGAKIACGGNRREDMGGYFFEPTVLVNVNHSMDCMMQETFGPTLPIMRVKSAEEAVRLANDSTFGLTASVWSRNNRKGEKLARQVRAGTVTVNDCLYTYGIAELPWGGLKESGMGRTHSKFGFIDLAHIKHINISGSSLKKDLWWFPYGKAAYNVSKSAGELMYGKSIAKKLNAAAQAAKDIKKVLG